MIVHVLRFAFRPELPERDRAEVLATITRTANLDMVRFGYVGQDLSGTGEFSHAYCVGVESVEALKAYMYHPVHLAGDRSFLPAIAKITAVDLSDDPDPSLKARVAALHAEKLAANPDGFREKLRAIPDAAFE